VARWGAGVAGVVLVCVAAAGCAGRQVSAGGGTGGAVTLATPGNARQARTLLARLQIGPWHSMRGYSRDRFRHWIDDGRGCNTRELVLRREGRQVRTTASCAAVAGRWMSPYDGERVSSPRRLDVDHLVPLANAWRSGADRWTDAQRERFANDLRDPELVAVTLQTNRAKGDQGPEAWRPPLRSVWCSYAVDWIAVKSAYRLTVTAAERSALQDMLGHC